MQARRGGGNGDGAGGETRMEKDGREVGIFLRLPISSFYIVCAKPAMIKQSKYILDYVWLYVLEMCL